MKILTKKKQKRLMFDLIDIFLMGSDALKAVGLSYPAKRDSCVPLVASGKAERRRKPKGRLSESRRKPRFQYAEREDFRPTGQRAKDNEHEGCD